jgi:hypothetical protein
MSILARLTDTSVLTLNAHGEVWMLLYREDQKPEALQTLGRWASDPRLSFDWFDACALSLRVRKGVPT